MRHLRLPPRRLGLIGALAVSALAGLLFAAGSLYSFSLVPPRLEPRSTAIALAATHVLLDDPTSLMTRSITTSDDFELYSKRAALFGNLIDTPPLRESVARHAGVPLNQLTTRSRLTLAVMWAMRDGDLEQRANQILLESKPYRLELQADRRDPVLSIYAQAPSVEEAERLANASVTALREYLIGRARAEGVPNRLVMEQLGTARGAVVNQKTRMEVVLLTGLVAFGVCLALLLAAAFVRRAWIAAGPNSIRMPVRRGMMWSARRARAVGGDWPHTTRVLPWMIAGFAVVLWLVPFNAIELTVSLPFDMKFDRLLLPVLFGVWVLTLAIGGPESPRLRLTLIHVGIAGFVIAASLSVVVNSTDLSRALEFDLSFKKITLLLSFTMLFLIVASSVRRSEVPAFITLNLLLAVICAVGTVWEYRFHYNLFYTWSDTLLPGAFIVKSAAVGGVDHMGRAMTIGPSDHPLEVTGMVTMALAITLTGFLQSSTFRTRALYALAACVLLAAAVSTYRKSALLAPIAVILTVAYFRRREILRLAPLGLVLVVAIHALSPGALGSVVVQLKPSRLGVATVSDRAADYDAVRPDLWSHLLFGRGYGSYDHNSYRVLDSEILSRVVDTGLLGVLAFVFMLVCIVIAGRHVIESRHPVWAPVALSVASSAVGYLTLTFLFDVSSFPHVPYILLLLAGLLAVVVSAEDPPPVAQPPRDLAVREPVRAVMPPAREPVAH